MTRWPRPEYHVRMRFDVPLEFAYRWCTDYRGDDATHSKERFDRRVLRRTRREVVMEDLWSEGRGWGWRRSVVTLAPPNRWHADSYGSFRDASIDYALTRGAPDRTRFDLSMRRRPSAAFPHQPSRAALEGELREMWTNYGRAMLRDYRRAVRGATSPGRRGR